MKKLYLTMVMGLLIAFVPVMAADGPNSVGVGKGMMLRAGPAGGGGIEAGMILRLKDKLELTAEQVTKLEGIRDEVKGKFKTAAETLRTKREALQKLVESGAKEGAIRAAAGEVGKAIGDESVLRAGMKTKVDVVLTDAQKAKLKELREQRMEQIKERQEQGGPMMRPGAKEGRRPMMGEGSKEGRRPMMGEDGKEGKRPVMGGDAASIFAKIDTNGDGSISLEEFKAHTEQMREQRGGRGPGGRGMPIPEEADK